MIRIVAGQFKGHRLQKPSDKRVRVTTEKVRAALFDIARPRLTDARVVDLFAGSGILGLEALSRGAAWVEFVDILPASLAAIRANIASLRVEEKTQVHRRDVMRFVRRLREGDYDLAIADPPFTSALAVDLAEMFREKPFAKMLVIEHRSSLKCTGDDTRNYGDVALTFCYSS